jgi:hypothetical protein
MCKNEPTTWDYNRTTSEGNYNSNKARNGFYIKHRSMLDLIDDYAEILSQ